MDYISKKLNQKIKLLEDREEFEEEKLYLRVKFEYELILILGYLWNENYNRLQEGEKTYIYSKVLKPSIGEIIEINRHLDINKCVFGERQTNKSINKYPGFRNDKIGHGYSFNDDNLKYIDEIKKMSYDLENNVSILSQEINLVNIDKIVNGKLFGIRYDANGNYSSWSLPSSQSDLEIGLYILDEENNYYRISPFVMIDSENDIYLYRAIQEVMIGRFAYNKLFSTETLTKEWDFFKNLLRETCNDFKKVTPNGTIINIFDNNYQDYRYIENKTIGDQINKFIKSKSCVYGTLWGHGGVGKTAAVQNYCEKLVLEEKKKFDYILFVSAKDRCYDYHSGKIQLLQCGTATYSTIIKNLNRLLYDEELFEEDRIINIKSKILLIIDDYETFSKEDKEKIEGFVKKLDTNQHKVLITTRSNFVIGDEIKTNEFNEEKTIEFFCEIYKSLFQRSIQEKITEKESKRIFQITSGRPIFILQLGYICAQRGLEDAIAKDYKNSKSAIDFLYGRIYDYLGSVAQKIFSVMGVLADSDDMTNLLEKVKYILNIESNEKFNDGVKEIVKLRLVEIRDEKFYRVYSKEILDIMREYFDKINPEQRDVYRKRILQISKDRDLDIDNALLQNANSAKYSQNEEEVENLFYQVINRKTCKNDVRCAAIKYLAEYLFTDRGNKIKALDVLDKYYLTYKEKPDYIKMYSNYAWSYNNREKAIELLNEFFCIKPNWKDNLILELFGNYVTYLSLYWVELREETKNSYRIDDISECEYKQQLSEQKYNFKNIHKRVGNQICELFRTNDFDAMNSGARQGLITGAYHYTEVCIRIRQWDEGKFLCMKMADKLSIYNYGLDFDNKRKRIQNYQRR